MPRLPSRASLRAPGAAMLSVLLLASGLILGVPSPAGAATRPFTPRFSTNAQGDITMVANTLMKCPPVATCAGALANTSGSGGTLNNNSYTMIPVDTDGDPATTNSSSADLILPPGASVLFARLYWGAVSGASNRSVAKFKAPGQSSYSTVNAPVLDDVGASAYQASIDVTALVQARGAGTYTLADIQLTSTGGAHAGWSMLVAYADPNGIMRNLTVFDGFESVSGGPVTINVSGFLTPPVGPVNTKLGVVAYEGDLGTTGDQLFLNNVAMSDTRNPANNFFNSSITDGVNSVTTRSPNDVNTMGFDADIISVPNVGNAVLANSATSASIRLTTTGDVYYPGAVTFVTDLYAPKITVNKTYSDVNGGDPRPGDVLEYTMTVSNTGKDPAINTVLTDAVPANTTYVPGSLSIVSGANAGTKTDTVGNDQGEIAPNVVKFFLGTGATGTAGGRLNENDVTAVKFRVTINASAPDNVPIPNTASVAFTALTLGSASVTPSLLVPVVVGNKADLGITKTDGLTSVVPGQAVSYTIVVKNNGTGSNLVENAVVSDPLPATLVNATWTCVASSGSVCDAASGTGSLNTTVDLAQNGTATFTVNATVDQSAVGSLTNVATVTPPVGVTDTVATNNSATDTDTLTPRADLSITKTNNVSSLVPGSPVTYTVVASNAGPSAVTGALVTDAPPAASGTIAWTCVASAGSLCPASGSGNISALTSLLTGGAATFTITYTVAADAAFVPAAITSLRNDAIVAAPTGVTDPVLTNNSAFDADPLTAQADLVLTKTHTPANIVPGAPVTYTITVTNPGPSVAPSASVSDTLPAGFTVSSITSTTWSCATTATFPCTVVALRPGTSTILVTGLFGPSEVGSKTNSATVASPSDTNAANNTGTDTATLTPQANLGVVKSHRPTNAVAGSTVTYVIDLSNTGPSTAVTATLVDNLPSGLTIVPGSIASSVGSPWTCVAASITQLSCSAASVPVGAASVTFDALVPAALSGSIVNLASVSSTTPDPVGGNDSSTDTATVVRQADLAIAKTRAVQNFPAGVVDGSVWTIVATNRGPSSAAGVLVNDTPGSEISGVKWTCVGAAGGVCPAASGAGPLVGSSVDLPVGASVTFTLTGTLAAAWPSGTAVVNTASLVVPGGLTDPNTDNNSSTDTTVAIARAALSIAKSNGQSKLVPGTSTTYTIVVANAGPAAASSTSVVDTLPSALRNATWECTGSIGGASCTSGVTAGALNTTVSLPAGSRLTFTVKGDVDPGATGTISNTVTVTAPGTVIDPDLTDNTATDSDPLTPIADIAVTKTVTGGTTAGSAISYTINVKNLGPSSATAVSIADALPSGLVLTGGWSCLAEGATSPCPAVPAGDLSASIDFAPGSQITFAITATVDGAFRGVLANTATATIAPGNASGLVDNNPDNNSASVTTDVVGIVALSLTKTDGVTTVIAGNQLTYTIVVANAGPSTAVSAPITDVFPTSFVGASWRCAPTAGSTCAAGNPGPVSGDIVTTATIASGGSVTYSITGTVDPRARTSISNTASVATPVNTTELVTTDNSATDTDTITARAALVVSKTSNADPGPVSSGQVITYIVRVTNAGPSATSGVPVTDSLPVSLRNASWTCAATNGAVCASSGVGSIATLVDLPPTGFVEFTVVGTVSDTARGSVVNIATAALPADVDPVAVGGPRSVQATNTLTIAPTADLSISKTDGVASVVPGETTTYTIIVRNAGPAAVVDAVVTDTPPVTFLSSTWGCVVSAGGLCASGGGSNAITTKVSLPPGGTATYTYIGLVDPFAHLGSATSLTNSASVRAPADVTEVGPGVNTAIDIDQFDPRVDLVVTKTDNKLTAVPGTSNDYAVTVTNNGPSAVANALFNDALPATLSNVQWSCAVFGAFNDCAVGSGTSSPISTALSLAPGATATISVRALIWPSARGVLSNSASVAPPAGTIETVGADNSATDTTRLDAAADLGVAKSHTGTLVPGTDATWTILVTNGGPSSVVGAAVNDVVPSALSNATWTCSVPVGAFNACGAANGTGSVSSTVDLGPGVTATYTLTARIDEAFTGSLTNTASVSAPGDVTDSSTGNNSSTDIAATQPTADLTIRKARIGSLVPGTTATYTVTVGNDGPSAARNARVLDAVPAPLTNVRWSCVPSGVGASCPTPAAGTGNLDALVSLRSGTTASFTVLADVPQNSTGTIVNTAQVLPPAGVTDPDPLDNSASDSGTAEPRADLRITKTDDATSVTPGDFVTYRILVTNDGPSAVPGAAVVDSLPSALRNATWTCAAPVGSSCSATSGTGDVNAQVSLVANAVATFTVTALIDPAARGALRNTATVAAPSSITDPNPGNDSATDTTTLAPIADLKIDKTHVGPLVPGAMARWIVTVTNLGPSSVASAAVADALPATVSDAQWFCSVPAAAGNACGVASGTGNVVATVDLRPGVRATFTIDGRIDAAARGNLTNSASVVGPSDVSDPVSSNNSSTDTGALTPTADLRLTKTLVGAAVPGSTATYDIVVTNDGPSTVIGARISDPLPTALSNASWTCVAGSGASCSTGTGVGNPAVDVNLGVGASASITVTATIDADARGSLINSALIDPPSDTTDPGRSNNRGTSTSALTPRADLSIIKTHVGAIVPGRNVTYTITASNAGPSSALAASIVDSLPSALTNAIWTCVASSGSTCPSGGNGNIATTVDLASGGTATFTLTATVDPTDTSAVTNTATIAPPPGTTDPGPGANIAIDGGGVTPIADLAVNKSHSGYLIPGRQATWTMTVTNIGPSAVTGATVTDALPGVVSSATWNCSVPSPAGNACGAVSGTGGIATTVDLLPGATATFTLTGQISPTATGPLSNTVNAAVPGGVTDPVSSNNSDTDVAALKPTADLVITKAHTPTVLVPGSSTPATYTITVWNNGPSFTPAAIVGDRFAPAVFSGATWTCAATNGASCGASGTGNINDAVDLPANSGVTYTISASFVSGATGAVLNTASVALPPGVTDPDPTSNVANDPGTLQPEADLTTTKTVVGNVIPGRPVTYAITVVNTGPSNAVDALVTDVLPAGLSNATWTCSTSASTAPANCDTPSGTGDIAGTTVDLNPSGSAVFTLIADLAPDFRGVVTNAASIAAPAGTLELDTSNNDGTARPIATPQTDLAVTKRHTTGALVPGSTVTYEITVTNNGPSTVTAANVRDALPAAISGVSWTCSAAPASTNGFDNACAISSGVGDVSDSVTLGVGAVATITVTGTIDPGARGALTGGLLINTATAEPPGGHADLVTSNDIGRDAGLLAPTVNLVSSKRHVGPLVPGANATYAIVVRNDGPSTAIDAAITDSLPTGLSNGRWTCVASGGTCGAASGVGSLDTTATLLPGGSVTYTLVAAISPSARGLLRNDMNATPTSGETDSMPSDNSSFDETLLAPVADLSLAKSHTGTLIPGAAAQWTIVVTNNGPSSVVDAAVTDTLPASLLGATWTCSVRPRGASSCGAPSGSGSISSTVTLASGATATYVLEATIDASTTGTVVNAASVRPPSDAMDPITIDNSDVDRGVSVPTADLSLVKTHEGVIVPGRPVTYVLVVANAGPSAVVGASVRDALPAVFSGATWTCVASAPNRCAAASGTGSIDTTVDLVASGSVTFRLIAGLVSTAPDAVVNRASVAAPPGVRDLQSSNDLGIDTGLATPVADLRITKAHVGPVAIGSKVSYAITVENVGPSTASGVGVTDIVPASLLVPTWTCEATFGSTCPASGVGAIDFLSDLAPGGRLTIALEGNLDASVGVDLVNSASLTVPLGLFDPDLSSNTATDRATVDRGAPPIVVPPSTTPPRDSLAPSSTVSPSPTTTLLGEASVPSSSAIGATTVPSSTTVVSVPSSTTSTSAPRVKETSGAVAPNAVERSGRLSLTGANVIGTLLAAVLLLLAGFVLVVGSRLRGRKKRV